MCFGGKDTQELGAPPARPVQLSSVNNDGKASYDPQRQDYAPPPGPPPAVQANTGDFAPPPGPPPSHRVQQDYAPPPGPPPAVSTGSSDFAPPPGPPPSRQPQQEYAPPSGPPRTHSQQPDAQRQHDWQSAVPDTALLPPPPNIFSGWDRSPTNNASEADADAGADWCQHFPLNFPAMKLESDLVAQQAIAVGAINLLQPPRYRGALQRATNGTWIGETARQSPDTSIFGYPPLYAPSLHSPLLQDRNGRQYTAYYEVHIPASNRREVSLAMGFAAMPYPPFRLPGWHRGSLAVHGDDGRRYVNDTWGGKDFTAPLAPGKTYGIGIRFSPSDIAHEISADVFFTVDGRLDGGWDVNEETDAERDRPVVGLQGHHDLSIAIGTFEVVKFEVRLRPSQWLYTEMQQERQAEGQYF